MFLLNIKNQIKRPNNSNYSQQTYSGIVLEFRPQYFLPISTMWLILNIVLLTCIEKYNFHILKIFYVTKSQLKKISWSYLDLVDLTLFKQTVDYTDCVELNVKCSDKIAKERPPNCICSVKIGIKNDLNQPVYISYQVKGFHQNMKSYYISFEPLQLNGIIPEIPREQCGEWRKSNKKWVMPCGALAHSLFNDTFNFFSDEDKNKYKLAYIPLIKSDRSKFKNPDIPEGKTLDDIYQPFSPPVSWRRPLSKFDMEYNGAQNPDFVNWMIPSPLATFVKPYRIITGQSILSSGNYTITIEYNYPITSVKVRKYIVLAQSSAFGPQNTPIFVLSIFSTIFSAIFVAMGIWDLILDINFFNFFILYQKRCVQVL
ncbi:LOW QUALITY PROTEIN: hypothetical protein HZS_6822 [Henneguya salminicola]|nr:LOW QUALITY PROTEIN: hypothetical protein HZS_6822 [Henneguya salminicola]